ncbi:MAG: glycosyltransferase involved in cell wall biosynthesis [Candidatus Latescibacterota bacterium]|jgi:glycosyltransferase involved in cell wall biosynthesis
MKYRFLIYISYSYSIPIGNPLEDEIYSRGHEVQWFADEAEGKEKLASKQNALSTIKDVVAYKPHIVLAATNMVPDFISGLKVQVFHGFLAQKRPSKKHIFSEFRIRGFFDLYCTQGPSTTNIFEQLEAKHKHFKVIETGWSKVDALFPLTSASENKKEGIPTIMIASTFTERLSLAYNEAVFQEIKRLTKTGLYSFKMVLHPKIPIEIVAKWKGLQNENFKFYDTTHLIPLFKQSDVLFADTTSAIQEFLLQKKPVVAFNHTFSHNYLIHTHQSKEIEGAINQGLKPPLELIKNIETFISQLHPYFDGKSSQRIVDSCIYYVHADKSDLKLKPRNLIRKFKIRNRLEHLTLVTDREPYTLNPIENFDTDDSMRAKITAIIPTGNEIHNIEEVIASVSFADEVLVVDSFSNDGTFEKSQALATRVIRRDYQYSASQKNWAIPQAKHDWVLLVDADERVTPALRDEILAILENPPTDDTVAYWMGRNNHFMGEPVKHSGWRNDGVIRLFKRDHVKYEDKNVHAEIIADGAVGKLKNKLYHNTYITLDKYLEKMNRYAWWQAKDYDKKTGRLTPYHFFIKPFWGFFKHYIIQGGYRDGVVGLTIGYIQGYTVFMRYAKLWLLRKNRH